MQKASTPILPVLDLMRGQIVRGIAGRRDTYQPIVSRHTDSADPLTVAQVIRSRFGLDEFYLADLDAIQQRRPAFDLYTQWTRDGFRLWIDAGLRTWRDAAFARLLATEDVHLIVGLESVEGPDELREMIARCGAERLVFSLDLQSGRPLGPIERWPTDAPRQIAEHAITNIGVRRLIVLDLANVGVGAGVSTGDLCVDLKQAHPHLELTTGGGVRGPDDLRRLLAHGVDRILVASALHDGRLTRADIANLQSSFPF